MILYLMNRMGLRYMDSTLLVVLRVVKTKGTFGEFFFFKKYLYISDSTIFYGVYNVLCRGRVLECL